VAVPRAKLSRPLFLQEDERGDDQHRIHNVLDHGANRNPGAGPATLREGIASARISLIDSVLAIYVISSSHCTCDLSEGFGGARSTQWGVNLLEDTVRREANRARNEKLQALKERR
jgi:hypothetical protein